MAMGRTERGSRYVITKVLRRRTELRFKNQEKNFEFNAGGQRKPMKLLCHKKGDEGNGEDEQ